MWIRPRRLVVAASIIMDVTVRVDRWPERGGDRLARSGAATPGGAFNLLAAARRLDLPAAYGGLVGSGVFGQRILAAVRALGVAVLAPPVPGDTGFDVAVVEDDGERTFITCPGTEAHLSADHLAALPLEPGDAVYISGYDLTYVESGAALAAWAAALAEEVLLVFDPGPLVAEIPAAHRDTVLGRCDLLTLNRREAMLLGGTGTPGAAAAALASRLARAGRVVVRDGAAGLAATDGQGGVIAVTGRPVRAVDTTGAGDVHTAALMARWAQGAGWRRALWEANVAASLAVEQEGPSASPTTRELETLLRTLADERG